MAAVGVDKSVAPIEVSEFFDYDRVQDKYMRRIKSVNKNHIFQVNAEDLNCMYLSEYDGAEAIKQQLVKKQYTNTEWINEALKDLFSKPKGRVGLQEIKWIELYDKWRKLVPSEERKFHYIKTDPGPEVRSKVKKHTGEAKKQRKDRSRTGAEAAKKQEEPPPAEQDESFGGKQPVASVPNTPQKI
jgi:hypothetical protein